MSNAQMATALGGQRSVKEAIRKDKSMFQHILREQSATTQTFFGPEEKQTPIQTQYLC